MIERWFAAFFKANVFFFSATVLQTEENGESFKGVTAPLSLKPPTELELLENQKLLDAIKDLDVVESEENTKNKVLALFLLQEEARQWISEICFSRVSLCLLGITFEAAIWIL